jgi:hypothetical protein
MTQYLLNSLTQCLACNSHSINIFPFTNIHRVVPKKALHHTEHDSNKPSTSLPYFYRTVVAKHQRLDLTTLLLGPQRGHLGTDSFALSATPCGHSGHFSSFPPRDFPGNGSSSCALTPQMTAISDTDTVPLPIQSGG